MSCEPGIYLPNVGGIRIEDDVVIIDGIGRLMNNEQDYKRYDNFKRGISYEI